MNASKKKHDNVIEFYNSIRNRSSLFNRSRPKSVAAGTIYYYLTTTTDNPMRIHTFANLVKLSAITVRKIVAEIETIVQRKRANDRVFLVNDVMRVNENVAET